MVPGRAQGRYGKYEFACSQAKLNENIVVEDELTTIGVQDMLRTIISTAFNRSDWH